MHFFMFCRKEHNLFIHQIHQYDCDIKIHQVEVEIYQLPYTLINNMYKLQLLEIESYYICIISSSHIIYFDFRSYSICCSSNFSFYVSFSSYSLNVKRRSKKYKPNDFWKNIFFITNNRLLWTLLWISNLVPVQLGICICL